MSARKPHRRRLDPRAFEASLERILAVLHNSRAVEGLPWATGLDISRTLREEHGIRLHWRTIDSTLARARDLVERRKRHRRWQYMLLSTGEKLIGEADQRITLIDPTKAVQAVVSLHAFLAGMTGTARICDPYVDSVTIEHLDSCARGTRILLLTKNITDSGKLRRVVSAARTAGRHLEIRVASSAPLHDRYLIDDKALLILGTSLNGFGKKQSFVIKTGADFREVMLRAFDSAWSAAGSWP